MKFGWQTFGIGACLFAMFWLMRGSRTPPWWWPPLRIGVVKVIFSSGPMFSIAVMVLAFQPERKHLGYSWLASLVFLTWVVSTFAPIPKFAQPEWYKQVKLNEAKDS